MTRFLLSSLLVLFLGTCVRAQTLPITYEKTLIGYRFTYDNLLIVAPNFRRAMALDPEARAKMSGAGAIEFGGVFLLSYGAAAAVAGVVTDEVDRGAYIGGGLATAALGAWLIHLADKKRVRAVDIYNGNLPDTRIGFRPVVTPNAGRDGIGITLKF